MAPLFALAASLSVQDGATATLKSVEQQAIATDAAIAGLAQRLSVDLGTATAMTARMAAPEIATLNREFQTLIPTIVAATTASSETDRAFQAMARSSLFVASTGNIAGRGMAGFIANTARLFGSGGIWLSALAIGGLALDTFFNRAEKGANKAEEASKKMWDTLLGGKASLKELEEETAKAEAAHALAVTKLQMHDASGGLLAPFQGPSLQRAVDQTSGPVLAGESAIQHQRGFGAMGAGLEQQMTEIRSQILRLSTELQTQIDEGHGRAVKLITADLKQQVATLGEVEAAYRNLVPPAAKIAEMQQKDTELALKKRDALRQEKINQAEREDKQKPAKTSKDNPALDAIEEESDALVLQRQQLELTGQQWTVAQAAVMKFADIQQRLNQLMALGTLDMAGMKRALGDMHTAMDEMATAGQTLNTKFFTQGQDLGIGTMLAKLKDVDRQMGQALQHFGQTIGTGLARAFGNIVGGGAHAKNAFAELGKTGLAAMGGMISQMGAIILSFSKLMTAFATAIHSNPLWAGPVGLGVGIAMMALGSALGAAADASASGGSASGSFSSYLGSASAITTLYGNPGTTNPLTGLPNPTGPQQPIIVNATIVGANDTNAGKQLVALLNATARTGPGGQIRSYAVQGR